MADDYTLADIVQLIDAIAGSTKAGFEQLESKVDALAVKVDRLDAKFDRLETRVEVLEAKR